MEENIKLSKAMENLNDTIISISTAYGKSAISILRLSGAESISIVNQCFKGKNLINVPSHTINYGHIVNPLTDENLDEVLVSVFKAPKTYTKEDVVEINCHGGIYITNLIMEILIDLGARPAEPGEFTKRAFLNGRIDLTKAEAVMDIINAENKTAIKYANQGINGKVNTLIKRLREKLLNIIAIINVNIDYPEYDDVEEITKNKLFPELNEMKIELEQILKDSIGAKYLKEGISTAIIGKPNVGKSTILNAFLEEEKAIVTDIPGTTRDLVECKVNIENVTLNLIDSAGIRETEDIVEKIGVEKSKKLIEQADLILFVLDSTTFLTEDEKKIIQQINEKPHLIIVNKNDKEEKKQYLIGDIFISAHNQNDIEKLKTRIVDVIFKDVDLSPNAISLANSRQIDKMKKALDSLNESLIAIKNDAFIDFIEIFLRETYDFLGEIIGETSTDSLINELFSKFCLGK